MVLILSGQFWNCPDSFKTVWILISLIQARKFTDLHWTLHSRYLINIKVNDKHCIYAFLRHFIFNTTREMITHFDMFTYFYTSRERFTHFFICRERRLRVIFLHVAKSGSALRPENFCAWKAAIRKVLSFCASADNNMTTTNTTITYIN